MDTVTSISLAEQRQRALRVVEASALVAEARKARRQQSRLERRRRVARLWRRTPTAASRSVADVRTARSIQVDHRASRLSSDGTATIDGDLTRFIEHAVARGATPLLLSVLADDDEPRVARQRAFGRIAAELAGAGSGIAT